MHSGQEDDQVEHESYMELSGEGSDVDMIQEDNGKLDDEDEVGIDNVEEEEDDEEPELEAEPEEEVESDELSPPPSPHKPRLKIKLKLPQILSPNEPSSRAASTPSAEPSQPPSRRGISRDDIESEDEDEEDEVVGRSTRPMTSRQAVLASVVDSSHVSLAESSRKKKQLTESEIALRREETARKRRNLTEKKLEDEKAETINRLLKKQSKSKSRRNALSTADDRTPVSATPAMIQSTRDGSEAPEGEVPEPAEIIPTMYRWISTTKPLYSDVGRIPQDDAGGKMKLTFSVPVSVLPNDTVRSSDTVLPPTKKSLCDVTGCEEVRKYRLVKDWFVGACGMEHLKILERQMEAV